MSSRRHIKKDEEKTDINISPLIDMVFILLIFFIVTTVFVEEQGLDVQKPTPQPPETEQEEKDEPLMFRITRENQVIHDNTNVTLNRVETIVKNTLAQSDVPVILQVERGALAGIMVQVMDRAKIANAETISVTSVE